MEDFWKKLAYSTLVFLLSFGIARGIKNNFDEISWRSERIYKKAKTPKQTLERILTDKYLDESFNNMDPKFRKWFTSDLESKFCWDVIPPFERNVLYIGKVGINIEIFDGIYDQKKEGITVLIKEEGNGKNYLPTRTEDYGYPRTKEEGIIEIFTDKEGYFFIDFASIDNIYYITGLKWKYSINPNGTNIKSYSVELPFNIKSRNTISTRIKNKSEEIEIKLIPRRAISLGSIRLSVDKKLATTWEASLTNVIAKNNGKAGSFKPIKEIKDYDFSVFNYFLNEKRFIEWHDIIRDEINKITDEKKLEEMLDKKQREASELAERDDLDEKQHSFIFKYGAPLNKRDVIKKLREKYKKDDNIGRLFDVYNSALISNFDYYLLEELKNDIDLFYKEKDFENSNKAQEMFLKYSKEERAIFTPIRASFSYKDHDRCIDLIQRALKEFPDETKLMEYLGVIYDEKGNKEKALEYYQKALKSEPENKDYIGKIKEINTIMLKKH